MKINQLPGTCLKLGFLAFAVVTACGERNLDVWVSRNSGTSDHIYSATTDGKRLVAVGANGLMLTSVDGTTWTSKRISEGDLLDVEYIQFGKAQPAQFRFVAVGDGGLMATSEDGVAWELTHLRVVDRIISVGSDEHALPNWRGRISVSDASGVTMTSSDGIDWTATFSLRTTYDYDGRNAVGEGGIQSTACGETPPAIDGTLAGVFSVPERCAFAAAVGDNGRIYSIPAQGYEWNFYPQDQKLHLKAATFADGRLIAVGSNIPLADSVKSGGSQIGEGVVLSSRDGASWKRRQLDGAAGLLDVVSFHDRVFLFGANGAILEAEKAARTMLDEWQVRQAGVGDLHSVIYTRGAFYAVGETRIMRSGDGVEWGEVFSTDGERILDLAASEDRWVAIGDKFWVSEDGLQWSGAVAPNNGFFYKRIAHGNGRFVALGNNDEEFHSFLVSLDGQSWTRASYRDWGIPMDITVGGARFLAITLTAEGSTRSSLDGYEWNHAMVFTSNPGFEEKEGE